MKWIVGPTEEQKGKGELDFSWTTPGEILILGSFKCSSGYPTDRCGCCRAFSGLNSRKATTIAVVSEVTFPIEKIARQDTIKFWQDTVEAEKLAEFIGLRVDEFVSIAGDIDDFEVGTRISVEFNPVDGGHDVVLFSAGSRELHGV